MNKFSKLTSVFLSALLLSMSSCGTDEIDNGGPQGPEVGPGGSLLITGEIGDKEAQTKVSETFPEGATNASGAKYNFVKDDVIGVFITGGASTPPIIANAAYKFVGDNAAWLHIDETKYKAGTMADGSPILWQTGLGGRSETANPSTFSAMYPYDKKLMDQVFSPDGKYVTTGFPTAVTAYPFTVQSNQNKTTATALSDYEKSDLLFAGKISRLEQKANFVFKHKMSRILINVRAGDGYKDPVAEAKGLNRFKDDYDTICASPATDALANQMSIKMQLNGAQNDGFKNTITFNLTTGEAPGIATGNPTPDAYYIPKLYKKAELPAVHFNSFAKTYAVLVPAQAISTTAGANMLKLLIKEAGKAETTLDVKYPAKITDGEVMVDFKQMKEGEQLVLNLTISKSAVVIDDVRIADWGTLGTANIANRNGIYDAKDLIDFVGDVNAIAAKTDATAASTELTAFWARWGYEASSGGNKTINIWNDIDLSKAPVGAVFESIKSLKNFGEAATTKFILDGTNYTISGLTSPLFNVLNCATVRNLNLEADPAVGIVGGMLAREVQGSSILNCSATGTVVSGEGVTSVGGLIGKMAKGATVTLAPTTPITSYVTNCWAKVNVEAATAGNIAGGLIGEVTHGVITNSYALGNVGKERVIVSAEDPVADDDATRGGLIGKINASTPATTADSTAVVNCYSRGIILPTPALIKKEGATVADTKLNIKVAKRGALVGDINANCAISYCFWNAEAICPIERSNGVIYPATDINYAIGATTHTDFAVQSKVDYRNLSSFAIQNNAMNKGYVVKDFKGIYPQIGAAPYYNLLNILIAEAAAKKSDATTSGNVLQDWALYGGYPIHTGVDVKQ